MSLTGRYNVHHYSPYIKRTINLPPPLMKANPPFAPTSSTFPQSFADNMITPALWILLPELASPISDMV